MNDKKRHICRLNATLGFMPMDEIFTTAKSSTFTEESSYVYLNKGKRTQEETSKKYGLYQTYLMEEITETFQCTRKI